MHLVKDVILHFLLFPIFSSIIDVLDDDDDDGWWVVVDWTHCIDVFSEWQKFRLFRFLIKTSKSFSILHFNTKNLIAYSVPSLISNVIILTLVWRYWLTFKLLHEGFYPCHASNHFYHASNWILICTTKLRPFFTHFTIIQIWFFTITQIKLIVCFQQIFIGRFP